MPTTWQSLLLRPVHLLVAIQLDPAHKATPKAALLDAMGRTVLTVDRLSSGGLSDQVKMGYRCDVRGNLEEVRDPYNRIVFEYKYDLKPKGKEEDDAANTLFTNHIDSGVSYAFYDAALRPVESIDSKGAQALSAYDPFGRPSRTWAKNKAGEQFTLRSFVVYADEASSGLTEEEATTLNLLGKP